VSDIKKRDIKKIVSDKKEEKNI